MNIHKWYYTNRRFSMKRAFILALALTIVGLAQQSFGVVLNATAENRVFFQDRGVVLRADPNSSYGGLAGYRRVDIGGADGFGQVGDIEIEILQAQNVESPPGSGTDVWEQSSTSRFQGYAAFEISKISVVTGIPQVEFKPLSVADPFGKLAAGECYALFADDGSGATTWLPGATTLAAAVGSVTDGSLYLTLGFGQDGLDTDSFYMYQRNDIINGTGNPESGVGFAALNVMRNFTGFLSFVDLNDPTEVLFGDPPGSGANPLETDVWGQQKFSRNSAFPLGSLFQFQSDDPLAIAPIPEPASLLVFSGLFGSFAALTVFLRRRKKA
jgi:hypothetical protein